jgi:hypothetical protein
MQQVDEQADQFFQARLADGIAKVAQARFRWGHAVVEAEQATPPSPVFARQELGQPVPTTVEEAA